MKANSNRSISSQIRFTLAVNATWSVLHDPVLTKMYTRHWKRYVSRSMKIIHPNERLLTLYGYVFNVMYKEV